MKKLFILFAFVFAVSIFASQTFPGWKCTDVAKLDAALAAAQKPYKKCQIMFLKQFALKPPATFAEVVTTIKEQAQAVKVSEQQCVNLVKQYVRNGRPDLLQAALAWSKANPSEYDIYFYLTASSTFLCLTHTDIYNGLRDNLIQNNYKAHVVKRAVDKMVDCSVTGEAVSMKADFQKLNRKYSKLLIVNKAEWEPIVALIRTTLDTL